MAFAPVFDLGTIASQTGLKLIGAADQDQVGASVGSAGDVNGDGVEDIIVGGPWFDPAGRSNGGAAWLVFGKVGGFTSPLDLAALSGADGFRIDGPATDAWLGTAVTGIGDINGDGFDDLAVGAPYVSGTAGTWSGGVYVVYGKASGFAAVLEPASLTGAAGFRIEGAAAGDRLGWCLAGVGDVNRDGFDDFLIGAPTADPSERDSAGASYLVFGKAAGFGAALDLATLNGANGFRIEGAEDAPDTSGESVAAAGDINGDGFADLIVGAPAASPGSRFEAGAAYVLYGAKTGFSASIDLSTLDGSKGFRIEGLAPGDALGQSVASAGDVNGDGFDDLLFGASGADPAGRSGAGAAFVVFGKLGGFGPAFDLASLNGANGFRINGSAAGDGAGASVAAAGDVNGDGYTDLLIGAPFADPSGLAEAGGAWLVYGRASGFAAALDLASAPAGVVRFGGASIEDEAGGSVAAAGDANGDGIDDLLLGAPFAEAAGRGEPGAAYLVYGFATAGASAGPDSFTGTSGADGFNGLAGDDAFTGGGGNDYFVGAAGTDKSVFSGASTDYEWWRQDEVLRVRDLRAGAPDGLDTLAGVETLQFSDRAVDLTATLSTAQQVTAAFTSVLRTTATSPADQAFLNGLIASVVTGAKTFAQAVGEIVQTADQTTAVAAMSYEFFLGFTPSGAGFDYLVSPTGPNPNNLNSAYYQSFNIENRYINFAVNLGKAGAGAATFQADYGAKTFSEATAAAYAEIFGLTPTAQKVGDILNTDVGGMSRAQYFALYGGDGLAGIGTKAAMVGWLLTEAAKADVGLYARSSNAFLADLADGAQTQIDLVGVYGHPEWSFGG